MIRAGLSRLRRQQTGATRTTLAIGVIVGMLATLVAVPAFASHYEASLEGSIFEIDTNANLVVNQDGNLDWANVSYVAKNDAATGQNDDSYGGGSKEDDTCPTVGTGSIPNNKSDLLTFGAYEEEGDPGFLHLFWTRVQEPSGTTLMDFELNQSQTVCTNGVNKVRTGDGAGEGADDLLIEYRIEQGGARAVIKVRSWTGSAWGPAVDLTAVGAATGTINSTAITSGPLSPLSARTFGEASIDLDYIFDETRCTSFGSAFLKSRASDAFTSQLKDFIAPVPIELTNCGKVIIRKETLPDGATDTFGFTKAFSTDPSSSNTFDLSDGGYEEFDNVLFGEDYTVTEDDLPDGWDLDSVDCSASSGVTPSITDATITFDIDDENDVLDCTYTNKARGTIVVEKIADAAGSFDFTSTTLPDDAFTLTTTAAGQAGKDSETFSDLETGTYDVAETVPDDWNLDSATCDDGSDPSSIGLGAGETVTCTFTNSRETGAILITKMRKHAADGPGDHPHQGVEFTITGGELDAEGVTVTTDENGEACVDGLVVSSFFAEGYTVTETVPDGYVTDDEEQTVSVTVESECGDGNEAEVEFNNTPLTDIEVNVTSQVEGGTNSSVVCVLDADPDETLSDTEGYVTDPEVALTDLLPGTYVCTIVVDP